MVKSGHDAQLLQSDLNQILHYFETWQLKVNPEKCTVLHLGHSNSPHDFLINNAAIPTSNESKDLGYLMTNNCSSNKYIAKIAATAHFRIKQMNISLHCNDIKFKVFLYCTYIRPLVEYVTPIWSPHLINEIDRVEKVQKRFTKLLPGMRNLNYKERLATLNLKSLEERRIIFDLILIYKIHNNIISFTDYVFFEPANTVTRGHNLKLKNIYARTNIKKFNFPTRTIQYWNNLPANVVNSDSLIV